MELHEGERIQRVDIEDQMRSAYIDYAMSVIVARALPDVRDGFKPVHRRVLFGMLGLGLSYNQPTKKSARIVGEVMGKYHPHGDSSVYDAMVRLAQPWSMRYPLVDGQGNFGSMDGDSPAAMRYTEARLAQLADEMLRDIDRETVDFVPNFDESLKEPTVLPALLPQLLVNGASGIAVGMATNMPPHNLSEVVDAICAYIDDPNISIDALMQHIKAPDFPTGGTIYGLSGVKEAFRTGKGRIILRAIAQVEETPSGRDQIIVTEIPYQVNKAEMISKIADLINDKKIDGISYINDESNRLGVRIVIILKRDANPNVVLTKLYKHSQLQTTYAVNNIALVDGRPQLLNLKDLIHHFVNHRHEVIVRRAKYDLRKAQERMHILQGYLIALDNIDEVVALIRASDSGADAERALRERFELSEIQAHAIVELRLRALTALERDKIRAEHNDLEKLIQSLNQLLADTNLQMNLIKEELLALKAKYGDSRRTNIDPNEGDFSPEDFYADEETVITLSHAGYIKRTPLAEFKAQHRGGKGSRGSRMREEDFIELVFNTSVHQYLLFFTEQGFCHWLRVYELPEGDKDSKGKLLQNLVRLAPDDKVRSVLCVRNLENPEAIANRYLLLATRNGILKKTPLAEYSRPRINGLIAISIRENDRLLDAAITTGNHDVLLTTQQGQTARFSETEIRPLSRKSQGVIGMNIDENDQLIGMLTASPNETGTLLVVSEKGFCKRSPINDYRMTLRRSKGVRTLNTEKAGLVAAAAIVYEEQDLMIITRNGIAIRFPVAQTNISSRNTKGVQCINIANNDAIASVSPVPHEEENNEPEENNSTTPSNADGNATPQEGMETAQTTENNN